MEPTRPELVTPRAWIAAALLTGAVGVGLVLFFAFGGDVRPILATVTTTTPAP